MAEQVLAPASPQVWPGSSPDAGWVPRAVPDMFAAPGEPESAAERAVFSDVAVDPPSVVSKVLGWVGSSGLLDSTPTGPVDSPIMWAMMAAVRKPGGKSGIETGMAGAGAGVQTGLVVDDAVELMAAPVTVDAASATAPSAFGQVKTATLQTQQSGPYLALGHHGTHREPDRSHRGRDRVGHGEHHRQRLRQQGGDQGGVLGRHAASGRGHHREPRLGLQRVVEHHPGRQRQPHADRTSLRRRRQHQNLDGGTGHRQQRRHHRTHGERHLTRRRRDRRRAR